MDPNATPTPPAVDTAAIEKLAEEKAQKIADERVAQMQEDLARKISGKSDYEPPKTWEELENRSVARSRAEAETIADEKVKAALAAERKAVEDRTKATLAQTEAEQKKEWAQMSKEWAEAVQDGVIPDIKTEIKEKLKAGTEYSALTAEEQKDPGLKAYNEGRILHGKLKQEGKSTSFYRTLEKFYNKQPAGARAPVIGGSTPTPAPSEEYTYEQIKANRKAKFNF